MVAAKKVKTQNSKPVVEKNQKKPTESKTKTATQSHSQTKEQGAKLPAADKQKRVTKGTIGGWRPGSGRPKGSHNKKTVALLEAIMETGQTPLEFMIEQMRNPKQPMAARLQAARDAAPFVHSKMQSIEISGPDGAPIEVAKIPVDPAEAMSAYKDLMG